jgi:hypothetical protein
MMSEAKRGTALTVFAVLFGLLAVSNLLKPLQLTSSAGFVFFGRRLDGAANMILGPLFGVLLAVYAYGIWNMRRFAMPIAHAYATYVILNLILFTFQVPEGYTLPVAFMAVYAVVAIGVSLGSAILLTQRKAELR